jgi:hypothetical protein
MGSGGRLEVPVAEGDIQRVLEKISTSRTAKKQITAPLGACMKVRSKAVSGHRTMPPPGASLYKSKGQQDQCKPEESEIE